MKRLILEFYWIITRAYLRLRGAEVGRNVRCNGFPYIRVRKGGRFIIGDNVNINVNQWSNTLNVTGSTSFRILPGATLELGPGVGLSGSRLIAAKEIRIGQNSLVGAGCIICDSDMHEIPLRSSNPVKSRPIRIGERTFIGTSSIILKGVEIGEGCVIAAGSVVNQSIPSDTMAGGNPASIIRSFLHGEQKTR